MILATLVLIDAIILGIWYQYSPFVYEVTDIASDQDLFEDVIRIEQLVRCSCKHKAKFTIGMYCFKGAMMICGILLSWQTRNAKTGVNRKSQQMAIYNVATLSLIGVICVSVLGDTTQYEALYAIVAVCICTCTTATLILVFVPKVTC